MHPLAQARFDRGEASASVPTGRIMLMLKRSPEQQAALKHYLDELQNPDSPNYHKWLTPEQYGLQFGISDTDLLTVTSWLQSQGFAIEKVPAARNVIEFSGSAGQIQSAFHTSIHNYAFHGEQHYANASEPQIPTALAPVVAGIASLNDFHPRSHAIREIRGRYDTESKTIKPDLTLLGGNNKFLLYVDPADAATIYNTPNQALNATYHGTTYDGTGVTIGIAGDSGIALQDVANYRAAFLNDTSTNHLPNVIVDGNDLGINSNAIEALLDMEVAGGIAPGATINFYAANNVDFQSGVFLAIYRALDDNAVSILNVSFGACEAAQGASGNLQILEAWEQAAAQGISVTVSTGDSGSAGCDDPNLETIAMNGLGVNGLASTPYNIAVGGTDFDILSTQFNNYVTASSSGTPPYYRTALKYIPENPWNDSTATDFATAANTATTGNTPFKDINGNTNIAGASGGSSSKAVCNGAIEPNGNCSGSLAGYAKPSFQKSLTSNDGVRDLPDVSLLAGAGQYGATWLVCADSLANGDTMQSYTDCQTTNGKFTSNTMFTGIGGTSASSAAFAGMLALIAQAQGGARLGQANHVLYNLAKNYPASFHDITAGNNSVYCQTGSPNCSANNFLNANSPLSSGGYDAKTGYDLATGLGSVDVSQLISNWSNAKLTSTSTSLQINGSTAAIHATHGTSLNFNVSVNPSSATGDVSIVNSSGVINNGAQGHLTLSNGTASAAINSLPGGSYSVYADYSGDDSYAASQSNGINVTISPENSTTVLSVNTYQASTGKPLENASTAPYGSLFYLEAQPYGQASTTNNGKVLADGLATGSVTFLESSSIFATAIVDSQGIATYNNNAIPPGSYHFTAQYSGDVSLNPSTSKSVPFTITKGKTTVSLVAVPYPVDASGAATLTAYVNTDSRGNAPTGTVTFTNGSTILGTVSDLRGGYLNGTALSFAELQINGSNLNPGIVTITATYSGDTNYDGSSANTTTQVSGSPAPYFVLNGPNSNAIIVAGPGNTGTGAITVTPGDGFSGLVNMACEVQAPAGITHGVPKCSLNGTSVSISGNTPASSTLSIMTASDTSTTGYSVKVTGTDATGKITNSILVLAIVVSSSSNPSGSGFTLSGPAISIPSAGKSGTSAITATSTGGFSGTVSLKCYISSSPNGAQGIPSCALDRGFVNLAVNGSATSTLTVTTSPSTTAATHVPLKRNLFAAAGGTALACVFLLSIPAQRRSWRRILGVLLFAGIVGFGSGCGVTVGPGPSTGGGTPPGGGGGTTSPGTTYVVTVSGVDVASGAIVSSTKINVTVH